MGENVQIDVDEKSSILTIKIDLKHRGPRSKSGKTIRVASSEGNHLVPGTENVVLGLNCYVPTE